MSVENFIDTNVFVYQLERLDTRKAAIAEHLIQHGIVSGTAVLRLSKNVSTGDSQGGNQLTRYGWRQSVLAPLLRIQPSLRLSVIPGQVALSVQGALADRSAARSGRPSTGRPAARTAN